MNNREQVSEITKWKKNTVSQRQNMKTSKLKYGINNSCSVDVLSVLKNQKTDLKIKNILIKKSFVRHYLPIN